MSSYKHSYELESDSPQEQTASSSSPSSSAPTSSSSSKLPLSSQTLNSSNINLSDYPQLETLKEIVPDLHVSILLQILRGNNLDLEKSIDAALALTTSLSYEKGTAVVSDGQPKKNLGSLRLYDDSGSRKSYPMKRGSSFGFKRGLIPHNHSSSSSSSISANNTPRYSWNSSKSTLTTSLHDHSETSRGTALLLDSYFLKCPRYRLTVDHHERAFTNFTIPFVRQNEKLGITIRELDGEISIYYLHMNGSSRPCLAMEAGVKIGDILTGINGDFFSPGVEVQDVLDILELAGRFVTLHFCRRHMNMESPYHKCAQMLLDQNVIKRERAQYVSKVLYRLKDRVMQWDSGYISQRIENWKLYKGVNLSYKTTNMSSLAASFSLPLDSMSSSNSTSFFGSMLQPSTPIIPTTIIGSDVGDTSQRRRSSWEPNMINSSSNMNGKSTSHDDMKGNHYNSFSLSYNHVSNGNNSNNHNINSSNNSGPMHHNGSNHINNNSNSNNNNNDIVIATRNLRPALSLRLLRAEEKGDHFVYVIWVLDVKSGAEWCVRRRFREFFEFRELLISIRSSITQLEFPPKRISVGEASAFVFERLNLIQKFLRKVSSLVTLNSLHPSTARVQLALQQFLDVGEHWYAITVLEKKPNLILKNIAQVYVHSVLQMTVMDKVLTSFLENFFEDGLEDDKRGSNGWNENIGKGILNTVKDFIDNLQNVLFDGISSDCVDIINKYRRLGNGELQSDTALSKIKQTINPKIDESTEKDISMEMKTITYTSNMDISDDVSNSISSEKAKTTENISLQSNIVQSSMDEAKEMYDRLTEDEIRILTRSAVRKQVEVEVYVPCAARLSKVLELSYANNETILNKKIHVLLNHDQHFFGIPAKQMSPTNWEDIVTQLRQIRLKTLPHDRLESLLDAAKEIPRLFQKEHHGAEKPLGADEFLPIFIYVLVHARIPDIFALNEELQALCDPDKKLSETGYYLATLEASLQHLMEFDENDGPEYFFHSNLMNKRVHLTSSTDSDDLNRSYSYDPIPISGTSMLASTSDDSLVSTPNKIGIHIQPVNKRQTGTNSSMSELVTTTSTKYTSLGSGNSGNIVSGEVERGKESESNENNDENRSSESTSTVYGDIDYQVDSVDASES